MTSPLVSHTEITPEYASHLLTTAQPIWQRNIKPHHLDYLTKEMSEGRWYDWTVIRLADTENGLVLMDGQHRLSAVISSKTSQKFVILTEFISEADAHQQYAVKIDTGSMRTVDDYLRATGVPENISHHAARVLTQAAKIIESNFSKGRSVSNQVAYATSQKYLAEYMAVEKILNGSELSKNFDRSPYIACSVYLIKHQSDLAMTFLSNVINGDVANPHDPSRRLREFILVNTSQHEAKYNREIRLKTFSRCWNARFVGQTLQKIYLPKTVEFFGTPLVGQNE